MKREEKRGEGIGMEGRYVLHEEGSYKRIEDRK